MSEKPKKEITMAEIEDFLEDYPIEEWKTALLFIKTKIIIAETEGSRWINFTKEDLNEYLDLFPPEERENALRYAKRRIKQAKKSHQSEE